VNGGLAAASTLANYGVVELGADDTIAQFYSQGGTLDGEGHTLTASTYLLDDGTTINANLGTGIAATNGAVALNGTSDAGQFVVLSGVTTLGSAERLRDDTDLQINSGAKLVLGGDEKIGSLYGAGTADLVSHQLTVDDGAFSGDLTGTGGLDKVSSGELQLSGASTYTGVTNVDAGTLSLFGSLESSEVAVDAGAVLNNVNGGLASGSTLSNDGTVNLYADDAVATFTSTGTSTAPAAPSTPIPTT
jgi:autotransporter-associated beta strand protein